MMKMTTKTIQACMMTMFLMLGSLGLSFAQDAAENAGEALGGNGKQIFSVTVLGDWKGDKLFVKQDTEYKELSVYDLSITGPLKYQRKEGVVLYQQEKVDGEFGYKPVRVVKIPPGIKHPLLLFMFNGKEWGVRIYELDDSNFPGGAYCFVNLCKVPILAKLNDKGQILKPGKEVLVKRGVTENERVMISASVEGKGGKVETLFSTMSINRPQKRMIMFFAPTEKNGMKTIGCRSLVTYVSKDE
ncbi:hypothetical protein Rhal01_01596 [Rubritalea halochordaticola]|uniref:DUF3108 domain-containing protein n=1 Tax=Rubritalea halochordaticola TaxID=714537 RepID=A0ABP9UYA0_9BACT